MAAEWGASVWSQIAQGASWLHERLFGERAMPLVVDEATKSGGRYFEAAPTDGAVYDKLIVWLVEAVDIPALDSLGGKSDVIVTASASGSAPLPPFLASSGLNTCVFNTEKNATHLPEWNRKRIILFERGGADAFNVRARDADALDALSGGNAASSELLSHSCSLPTEYGTYVRSTVPFAGGKGSLTFAIKLERGEKRVVSAADIAAFPMEYETFANGSERAVLGRHCSEKNTRAVLWLPGRCDAFFHPHVGRAFDAAGYDVYVLNYHNVGVCRRFGLYEDPYLTSHIASGSMDEYVAEIDSALVRIALDKTYSSVLGYAHSTGAPILCNYLIRKGDGGFDGFILNSPFFDWGEVGGDAAELILERAVPWIARTGLQRYADPFGHFARDKPSAYATKIHANYEFDPRDRPLFGTPTTVGFILAVDRIQAEIRSLGEVLTRKPVLLLASQGDDVLSADEIVSLIRKVADADKAICEAQRTEP